MKINDKKLEDLVISEISQSIKDQALNRAYLICHRYNNYSAISRYEKRIFIELLDTLGIPKELVSFPDHSC